MAERTVRAEIILIFIMFKEKCMLLHKGPTYIYDVAVRVKKLMRRGNEKQRISEISAFVEQREISGNNFHNQIFAETQKLSP